jgi:hypothetical protein
LRCASHQLGDGRDSGGLIRILCGYFAINMACGWLNLRLMRACHEHQKNSSDCTKFSQRNFNIVVKQGVLTPKDFYTSTVIA